ncbi:MAG: patatin-like phospholipase family protein [Bacteroidota bacterium]
MKRALVLSGGGANGAFQVGALEYIEKHVKRRIEDFHFNIINGVSVGAINGVMLAMDKFPDLIKIWDSPKLERLIFTGRLEMLNVARKLLTREKSVLSNRPLFELLKRYVSLSLIDTNKFDFRLGAVSLRDGKYLALSPDDFERDLEFQKAILASASIPILWAPVPSIETREQTYYDVVDGSIRDTSPLGHVIQDHPDEIIIINCYTPDVENKEIDESGKDIFSIASRALIDIALDEIFVNDLREFLTINDLVAQVKAQSPHMDLYRMSSSSGRRIRLQQFQTILIEPEKEMGNIIDFSPAKIQERRKHGFEMAKKAFSQYDGSLKGHLYSNRSV